MTRILALDPGSTVAAWALVVGEGARVAFGSAGRVSSTEKHFAELLHHLNLNAGAIDLVAVEEPQGFIHDKQRSAQVVATAGVAGGMLWSAKARGYAVLGIRAAEVRKLVVGKTRLSFDQKQGDMDRAIKAALPSFVDGIPERTNEHTRDALALAVAANWVLLSKQRASA